MSSISVLSYLSLAIMSTAAQETRLQCEVVNEVTMPRTGEVRRSGPEIWIITLNPEARTVQVSGKRHFLPGKLTYPVHLTDAAFGVANVEFCLTAEPCGRPSAEHVGVSTLQKATLSRQTGAFEMRYESTLGGYTRSDRLVGECVPVAPDLF
jgi:hypothetical protein